MTKFQQDYEYCLSVVRQASPDRYVAGLLAPETCQGAIFALYALQCELAKTRTVVTEPLLGKIRLQWWRDEIDKIYQGQGVEHPILSPLAKASQECHVPQKFFDQLLAAYEADLEEDLFETKAAFFTFVTDKESPVFAVEMCFRQGNADWISQNDHLDLCVRAGKIWGGLSALRSFPVVKGEARFILPLEVAQTAGLDFEKKLYPLQKQALQNVIRQICLDIEQDLTDFEVGFKKLSKAQKGGFCLLGLVKKYCTILRGQEYDVFAPKVQMTYPFRGILLWGKSKIGLL